jgi:hypothetical protein
MDAQASCLGVHAGERLLPRLVGTAGGALYVRMRPKQLFGLALRDFCIDFCVLPIGRYRNRSRTLCANTVYYGPMHMIPKGMTRKIASKARVDFSALKKEFSACTV